MIFDQDAAAAGFYASLSKTLKDQARPHYPEVDSLSEADAIEFCLAFNRARKNIAVRQDFEDRRAHHALRQGA